MSRRIASLLLLLFLFMLQAPIAHAKGPLGASIEGDGVAGVLDIRQAGETGQGTAMSRFVEAIGFFELTFGKSTQVATSQPTQTLGKSRLTITWDMGGGDTIEQELYLHAAGGPVSHVAGGQKFWENTTSTVGGWFTISGDIATPLMELGVRESAVAHLTAKDAADKDLANKDVAKKDVAKKDAADKDAATKDLATKDLATTESAAVAAGPTASAAGGSSAQPNGPGAMPAVAIVLAAAIIGVGTWIRMRHPATR